jgi:ribonucleotide monophosphatase NagD (HAD superfamily)
MIERPKTIFSDIDGTLLRHCGDITTQHNYNGAELLLPGVKENIIKWDRLGYKIVLVTGRRESTRKRTEEQLLEAGVLYDQLVMGVSGGIRVLINDRKPSSSEDTAICINLTRNGGIENVNI